MSYVSPKQPFSPDAERCVLGGILLDGTKYWDASGNVVDSDFFDPSNRKVFAAITNLVQSNKAVDYITVKNELERVGQLADVGGIQALMQLTDGIPLSLNVDSYSKIIKDKAILRRLIAACDEMSALGYQGAHDPRHLLDLSQAKLAEIADGCVRGDVVEADKAVTLAYSRMEERTKNPKIVRGMPSGWTDLDMITRGFEDGALVTIAARPGMGKTTLMMNMANHAGLHEGKNVAVVSLEMSTEKIMSRMIYSEAMVNSRLFETGHATPDQWEAVANTAAKLSQSKIRIIDSVPMSLMDLKAIARRLKREGKLDLLIVDYLQLLKSGERHESRVQEVSHITRELKVLAAKELNIPIVTASQMNRSIEHHNRRPQLSDLRESGCLAGETLIALASGQCVPIRDLVGMRDFGVWSLNHKTLKLETSSVANAFYTGAKPVFKLTTGLGRSIRATANHKFLTTDGWKRLDELQADDRIALPRKLDPSSNTATMPAESDVYWDSIASISEDGVSDVYDLTVPGNECFVAGGVIVHNSIEQDSDVVVFIHQASDGDHDAGDLRGCDVELIVSKNRNEQTGSCELMFAKNMSRFIAKSGF